LHERGRSARTKVKSADYGELSGVQQSVKALCNELLLPSGGKFESELLNLVADHDEEQSRYCEAFGKEATYVATSLECLLEDPASFDIGVIAMDAILSNDTLQVLLSLGVPLNLAPSPRADVIYAMIDYKNYAVMDDIGSGLYGIHNMWNLFNPCVNCDVQSISRFLYSECHLEKGEKTKDCIEGQELIQRLSSIIGGVDFHPTPLVKGTNGELLAQTAAYAKTLGCSRTLLLTKNLVGLAKLAIVNLAAGTKVRVKASSSMLSEEVWELTGQEKYLQRVQSSRLLDKVHTIHGMGMLMGINKSITMFGDVESEVRKCINSNITFAYEIVINARPNFMSNIFNVWGKDKDFYHELAMGVCHHLAKVLSSHLVQWQPDSLPKPEKVVFDALAEAHTEEGITAVLRKFKAAHNTAKAIGEIAERIIGQGPASVNLEAEALSLPIPVSVQRLKMRLKKQIIFQLVPKLASVISRGGKDSVDFAAQAQRLGLPEEDLRKKVNKQIINQSAPKLASVINSEGQKSVDFAAKAKVLGTSEEDLRQRVNKQIIFQSAGKLAAGINSEGESSVDFAAKAKVLGTSEEDLRKKVETQQGNQNKLGTSSTLAAAISRGESVDYETAAKSLGLREEDLRENVTAFKGNQDSFTVARKFAARQQKGSDVFDVHNKEIEKASKECGISPTDLINSIKAHVKGIKKGSDASRRKQQLDLLEAGGRGKETVHRASCNKCTNIGGNTTKFVNCTKPNVVCHGVCPIYRHTDWTVQMCF